jgi:hypothetical protein
VVEPLGLLAGEVHHLLCAVREAIKHVVLDLYVRVVPIRTPVASSTSRSRGWGW